MLFRSFSKAYGLAGERVGWATGAPGLVQALNRIRGAFPIGNGAQATCLAAAGDQAFVTRSRQHNAAERARFVEAIEAMGNHGIRAVPSEANFVLLLFEGKLTGEAAYNGLAARGYITRWLPGQGLPHGVRITIGTAEHMGEIAAALREMAEGAR